MTRVPGHKRQVDELIVEEPMSIQLDGIQVTTTMRTPGHDYELAVGFCHSEGLLGGAPVVGVRYCADGSAVSSEFNVVTVETGGRAPAFAPRLGLTSTSCGLCGSDSIDTLCARLAPLDDAHAAAFEVESFARLCHSVLAGQTLFNTTGAVHGGAAFDAEGNILVVREDVGRHNAVDKVVGWGFGEGLLPLDEAVLCVSGRLSFELVQKTACAGAPVLVGVGAPSSLAVELARAQGITLCGFARGGRFNVYAGGERIAG